MKLSETEKKTLARWFMGGVEAVRCERFMASCSTITSLLKKGMLNKNGMTEEGRKIGKELADGGVV